MGVKENNKRLMLTFTPQEYEDLMFLCKEFRCSKTKVVRICLDYISKREKAR